jgi:hypothetical protein
MPKDVIPQVGIGSLAFNGVAAFLPVLAAMTADSVQPTAMIQLENLGAIFHTTGSFVATGPDFNKLLIYTS